ncbi:sex peptide receptor [Eurytemora carolleeae]|uniref:sex peptide receptor n=1 Tax=Eurytemora carolleeae TaxID=1294199 RepID=UPI000C75B4E8|nr:sex peptide receptor [Eurytemora carolleeae]|eukprot:XP_023346096.1 sex peptide receptor-like [Eurytemora affinis]
MAELSDNESMMSWSNESRGSNISTVNGSIGCVENGTCYRLNASDWLGPINMVEPIYGIIMPILILITILSNTLIIIVLSRNHTYFIFPAPWYMYLYTMGHHDDMNWGLVSCYLFEFMMETSPQIFHSASNWLTLALAVQRYIYVCHASMAKQWCTVLRSQVLVVVIVLVSLLHMITRMVDRTYNVVEFFEDGEEVMACTVQFSDWLKSISLNAYFLTFYWFRVIFVQLVPCVALVILNTLLFSAMKRAERRRQKLMAGKIRAAAKAAKSNSTASNGTANKRQRDANSTTLMLIVVIAIFLTVEIPLMVITALHTISSSLYEFLNYELVKKIIVLMNVGLCLSYPLNFGIYCGMSRQFRETFKNLFVSPILNLIRPAGSNQSIMMNSLGVNETKRVGASNVTRFHENPNQAETYL